ncbi:16S rRNA (guanine(527)-N(7))-methyltransferase RsmG [Marivivens aquimaris]|uniref:16S rRNA (guanine(527)-N(7))-methyltransferase RsmG n=1 Tax=Marivivens aquimaris TaxID=2774876 RepID=UPI001880AA67|nr:16S rRNA (guanine(527)-N(7))-methyltransferase RsmG [Marivivens aquimaris]
MITGLDVSRETEDRLRAFSDLVLKWTTKINLIAKGTQDDIWDRHIIDSAQVWLNAPAEFSNWVDIGSGGGFPAIVLATIAREQMPGARFTLIESDQRKATFLRTAIWELNLNAKVIAKRIEEADPQNADVVSARALASLDLLLGFADQHLRKGGVALFQKGKGVNDEIDAAKQNWSFAYELHDSITDAEAKLVAVREIARV